MVLEELMWMAQVRRMLDSLRGSNFSSGGNRAISIIAVELEFRAVLESIITGNAGKQANQYSQ